MQNVRADDATVAGNHKKDSSRMTWHPLRWLTQAMCPHDLMRHTTPTRIFTRCEKCGYASPGWDVAPAKPPQAPAITRQPISARPVLRLRRRQG